MGNPIISIIVPVHNMERYLRKCVDSLLTQTHTNLEIILVNDGSTDSSPQICDAYAAVDARVRVIHQQNAGLSAARNAGIERSTGSLIGFVDSDDFISPNMYEDLLRALEMNDADMSMCGIRHVFEEGSVHPEEVFLPRDEVVQGQGEILSRLGSADNWLWVVACNKLYRRALFQRIRYPVGKLHEDEFVIHHVLLGCDKVACISDALYYYFQRSDSITGSAYSLRRLDGAQAQFERARTLLDNGMPPSGAYHACAVGLHVLANSYTRLDVKSPAYQQRYRQLLAQYRQAASRLMKEELSPLLKARLWLNARSPYYTWKFLERFLRR